MNREDWLDYFEAINGRIASEEEIAQALRNGEFQDEIVVTSDSDILDIVEEVEEAQVETKVQEPTVQQPISAPKREYNGQQEYSYTGQQQNFSTNPNPNPSFNQSQTTEQAKVIARGFWSWLVSAWKSPTSEVATNKYNGYLAFGLLALFYTITLFTYARRSFGAGLSILSSFTNNSSYGAYNPVGLPAFLSIYIAAALFIFSVIFAGFITKRLVYKDESFTFTKSFEWYGRLFSVNLLIMAISSLGALLGLYLFSIFCIYISFILFSVASTFAIAYSKNVSPMDMFYKYLIAIVVNSIVLIIFAWIEFMIVASYITSLIPSFF